MTSLHTSTSKLLLETALTTFLRDREGWKVDPLYKWYYEQQATDERALNLDLAFADEMLDTVEKQWAEIMSDNADAGEFMKFEERNNINEDGEEDDAF